MKYYVYVLRSEKDGRRYIGMTGDIDRRLREHSLGLVKSTKYRRPLNLIHIEEYVKKSDAEKRERFFKTGQGRKFLNDLIA